MKKNRPIHSIQRGYVEASIWQNETDKGPMYNVTFIRKYKDGEELKKSSSFGMGDLLRLSRVALLADDFVYEQIRKK